LREECQRWRYSCFVSVPLREERERERERERKKEREAKRKAGAEMCMDTIFSLVSMVETSETVPHCKRTTHAAGELQQERACVEAQCMVVMERVCTSRTP
jgi:hypothetical protein